jgi:hypothetical protein
LLAAGPGPSISRCCAVWKSASTWDCRTPRHAASSSKSACFSVFQVVHFFWFSRRLRVRCSRALGFVRNKIMHGPPSRTPAVRAPCFRIPKALIAGARMRCAPPFVAACRFCCCCSPPPPPLLCRVCVCVQVDTAGHVLGRGLRPCRREHGAVQRLGHAPAVQGERDGPAAPPHAQAGLVHARHYGDGRGGACGRCAARSRVHPAALASCPQVHEQQHSGSRRSRSRRSSSSSLLRRAPTPANIFRWRLLACPAAAQNIACPHELNTRISRFILRSSSAK